MFQTHFSTSDVTYSNFLFAFCLAQSEEAEWKMADGVDHIDIYADVEEEFNQVF